MFGVVRRHHGFRLQHDVLRFGNLEVKWAPLLTGSTTITTQYGPVQVGHRSALLVSMFSTLAATTGSSSPQDVAQRALTIANMEYIIAQLDPVRFRDFVDTHYNDQRIHHIHRQLRMIANSSPAIAWWAERVPRSTRHFEYNRPQYNAIEYRSTGCCSVQ